MYTKENSKGPGRGRQNVKGTEKGSIDVMLKSLFSSQLYARKKPFSPGGKIIWACMFKIRNIRCTLAKKYFIGILYKLMPVWILHDKLSHGQIVVNKVVFWTKYFDS